MLLQDNAATALGLVVLVNVLKNNDKIIEYNHVHVIFLSSPMSFITFLS